MLIVRSISLLQTGTPKRLTTAVRDVRSHKAVSAYFTIKQILPFVFAEQYTTNTPICMFTQLVLSVTG